MTVMLVWAIRGCVTIRGSNNGIPPRVARKKRYRVKPVRMKPNTSATCLQCKEAWDLKDEKVEKKAKAHTRSTGHTVRFQYTEITLYATSRKKVTP